MIGRRGRPRAARRAGPPALGLRGRVAAGFGAGTLVLVSSASVATWWLSASYLQAERTRTGTAEAIDAAAAVQQGLEDGVDVPRLLERVSSPRVETLLHVDGESFSSALALTPAQVPDELVDRVEDGEAVRQRVVVDDRPRLLVGVPLPAQDAVLVAALPLTELDQTLRTLSVVLALVTVTTTLAAVALGSWVARRALRPLLEVNKAAGAVAAGDLTTRLRTDDPDLRQLAATFNATVAALRARVERDARFAADVSHELRSPLTTMANAVSVMSARRHELSPTSVAMLDALEAEVARFRRIVRDLLEISLEDSGREMHAEPVRIAELVREAVRNRSDVPVLVEAGAETAVVDGDRRRLDRVMANLLENAEKHAGGPVAVTVRSRDHAVELVVDDAGAGVPEALRSEVFERFNRGPQARTGVEGGGLGLALVARHVRLHRGSVWVEDRPGGGARFVVSLPVAPP